MSVVTEGVGFTSEELLEQNKQLSEELKQCQKDKDFVWNLWKSLQNEKPDIAEVIREVVQREQKKSDEKDLKVLTILHQKDEQIKVLQDISEDLQVQLKECNERLSELLLEKTELTDEKLQLENDISELNEKFEHTQHTLAEKDDVINNQNEKLNLAQEQISVFGEELENAQSTIQILNEKYNSNESKLTELIEDIQEKDKQLSQLAEKVKQESKEKHHIFMEKCDLEKQCWQFKETIQKFKLQNKDLKKRLLIKEEQLGKKANQFQQLENSFKTPRKEVSIHRIEQYTQTEVGSEDNENEDNSTRNVKQKVQAQAQVIEKLHNLLNSMTEEMQSIRNAHQQRLQRYKVLKENYNLVQQQLKTYEKSNLLSPNNDDDEEVLQRASPASLQREDSRSVWNELTYYKKQFEKLNDLQPELMEELDRLRVKSKKENTKISQLNLRLAEFEKLIIDKENISKDEVELLKEEMDEKIYEKEMQIISLLEQLNEFKEKLTLCEKELVLKEENVSNLNKQIVTAQSELREFDAKITDLSNKLSFYSDKQHEHQFTQTNSDESAENSKQLYDKMVEVIDHLTLSQQESSITESFVKKTISDISTQTQSSQENFSINNSVLKCDKCSIMQQTISEITDQNNILITDKNKLLVLQMELQKRNKLLKDRWKIAEEKISHMSDGKECSEKAITDLHDELDGIQEEMKTVLHSLQATKSALKDRTKELSDCREELDVVSTKYEEQTRDMKNLTKDYKALEKRFKDFKEEYDGVTNRIKTLTKENNRLTEDIQQLNEKHTKLEHLLNHKKLYCDELKRTNSQLKENYEEKEKQHRVAASKLKSALDRETSAKEHIDNLKSKIESNKKIISDLEKVKGKLQNDLSNKTRMLADSQQLCLQAESAITEMEKATYKQLKAEEQSSHEKEAVLKENVKYLNVKCSEYQSTIREFFEALLFMIRENRSNLLRHMKEKQRIDLSQLHDAPDIACSILDMSTSDLKTFMEDGMSNVQLPVPDYEESDMRSKLDLILTQKNGFSEILSKFLLDLIHYNWSFLSKDLLLNNTEPHDSM